MKKWPLLPRRWRVKQEAAQHASAIVDILDTSPIVPRLDGVVLFSMIGTADVLPFLVSVKSLWHNLRRGRIALLDDGTLTGADKAVLAHHCGDPEILSLARVDTSGFPAGVGWARFLSVLDRRSSEYWIMLDSNTVTLGGVPDVVEALALNRSFALPCLPGGGKELLPLGEFARSHYPGGPVEGTIAAQIESRLGQIGKPEWRYFRGCAGLAGFAAGGPGRPLAAAFLAQLEKLVGKKVMHAPEIEQIAMNFHIANEPRAVTLPCSRFLSHAGEKMSEESAFIYFGEAHRYTNAAYETASRRAIGLMRG